MSDFLELRTGMRLMIPSSEGALAGYYHSAVRRIDGRGLLIDMPRLDTEDLEVRPGQLLKIFVQLHGRLYEFESRVRSADLQVLLEEPGQAKKTERRAFFRLMLSIPARMTILPGPDADDDAEPITDDVTVVDLSGGGVRIHTKAELAAGTEFDLQFPVAGGLLNLRSQVVRATVTELARGGNHYEAHCMFTRIKGGDQDAIIKFLFQKQREFSQRGVA